MPSLTFSSSIDIGCCDTETLRHLIVSFSQISKYYKKVIATDVAAEQLKYAERRDNVTYAATPRTLSEAELTRIVGPEGSVDLVLVVEALHWFDLENFYSNVRRVLRKPGGVIAASVYPARPKVEPRVNKVLDEFYAAIERHWAPQVFRYVDPKPGYERLPFPFAQGNVTPPKFEATVDANLEEFLEYLRSWSAVQTAIDQGEDPLSEHQKQLFADAWGDPETVRCLKWPLSLLVGTANAPEDSISGAIR